MASHIKVDLPIMQETVSKYDQAKGSLNDAIIAMQSAVQSVEWTGEAARAFKAEFDLLVKNLNNSETIMQDAENDLKSTIDKMETAEQAATNSGKTLDKGNASLPI